MSLSTQPEDPPTLTQEEEEEMSTALIARLLAQDAMNDGGNDYYAQYGIESQYYQHSNNSDYGEESDDYAPKQYGKQKKVKAKKKEPQQRGQKRKNVPTDTDAASSKTTGTTPTSGLDEKVMAEPPVKIKKVKKPLPPGFNTGIYTDNEEVLFLEGLDLHGRNWNELSKHMGTRDPHSIRSHAQKHFIKLYRDNLPLPDKVKESGEGFTLSGKPLDPDSASAKPYLNRMSIGNKAPSEPSADATRPSQIHPAIKDKLGPVEQPECRSSNGEFTKNKEKATEELMIGRLTLMPADQQPHYTSTDNQATPPPTPTDKIGMTPICEGNGCTNHATCKLRHSDKEHDPSTMVKCQPFAGNPGSDIQGTQPFKVIVNSTALLMMDLHSHLATTGILGFLAGEWNSTTHCIQVKEAYPCVSSATDLEMTMDSISAMETRHTIEEKGLNVIGWYRFHPSQLCDSSLDLAMLYKHQALAQHTGNDTTNDRNRTSSDAMKPFVCATIGQSSTIHWYHFGNGTPQPLDTNVQQDTQLSPQEETRILHWLRHAKMELDQGLVETWMTRLTPQVDAMEPFMAKIRETLIG